MHWKKGKKNRACLLGYEIFLIKAGFTKKNVDLKSYPGLLLKFIKTDLCVLPIAYVLFLNEKKVKTR